VRDPFGGPGARGRRALTGRSPAGSHPTAVATGDPGMLDLSHVLGDRYGAAAGTVFLVGFYAGR